MTRRLSTAALLLAVYAAVVAWITWPLAAHLGTHLPNPHSYRRFDTQYMAWVLAHESHTLASHPTRLLDTNIFHPVRHTLFYGDTGFGALPYYAPAFLLTGNPTLAINLVLLGGVTLTAWTLHLVVRRWTGSELGGFLAAWTLLTTRWVLWYFIPTAPSYAMLQYLPVIVLLAAEPARRFTQALALLPLVVLQCLADVVYIAPAVLFPLALLAGARLFRRATRGAGVRLFAVLGLALLALLPVYAGHLAVRSANPGLTEQTLWHGTGRMPSSLPWGPLSVGPTAIPAASTLLIVVGALCLVPAMRQPGPGSRRPWAHAAFWAFVGVGMSLSPTALWFGVPVRLPTYWLGQWLPVYRLWREPMRLGLVGLVGLALLAGLAFAECARRLSAAGRAASVARVAVAACLAIAMYAGYARPPWAAAARGSPAVGVLRDGPFAGQPLPASYPIARAIGPGSPLLGILRAGSRPLLELPVDPADGPPLVHASAMYRSIFHWRPLVNGYSSYWPRGFPERMALARRLPERDAVAALRAEAGLELILVRLADFGLVERELCDLMLRAGLRKGVCPADPGAAERARWLDLAARGGREDLALVARDGDALLFAVTEPDRPR